MELVKAASASCVHGWFPLLDKHGRLGRGAIFLHVELEPSGVSGRGRPDRFRKAEGQSAAVLVGTGLGALTRTRTTLF